MFGVQIPSDVINFTMKSMKDVKKRKKSALLQPPMVQMCAVTIHSMLFDHRVNV